MIEGSPATLTGFPRFRARPLGWMLRKQSQGEGAPMEFVGALGILIPNIVAIAIWLAIPVWRRHKDRCHSVTRSQ